MQFALPVTVTSAINPIFARATMLLIANHMIIVTCHSAPPSQFHKGGGANHGLMTTPQTGSFECLSLVWRCYFLFCPSSVFEFAFVVVESAVCEVEGSYACASLLAACAKLVQLVTI